MANEMTSLIHGGKKTTSSVSAIVLSHGTFLASISAAVSASGSLRPERYLRSFWQRRIEVPQETFELRSVLEARTSDAHRIASPIARPRLASTIVSIDGDSEGHWRAKRLEKTLTDKLWKTSKRGCYPDDVVS